MKRASKPILKVDILENSDPISAETETILRRIRHRAFEISQARPHDAHQRYDWMMAESETIAVPPVQLTEKNGTFEVKFAVPGVSPEDVNVSIAPDQILLKAETTEESDSNDGIVHLSEFSSRTIFRSLNLPQAINPDTVKISFNDGVVLISASSGTGGTAEQASGDGAAAPSKSARKAPSRKSQGKTS